MRARVAKYHPRTTFHTASEYEFSEVRGEFIADSLPLASVVVLYNFRRG
jgi:hypothetical protein